MSNESPRFVALRERFTADRGADERNSNDQAIARLERALDAIGWRSAGGESSAEVAADAVHIVADCVNRHHSMEKATDALAELLYRSAAALDGSMHATSAYAPAADEVLRRYASA